jgi:hypothetical protein
VKILKSDVREESVECNICLAGSSLFSKTPRFIRFVFLNIS